MASTDNSYVSNAVSSEQYQNNETKDEAPATPQPAAPAGFLWRMGSGAVNLTKGAVGGTIGLGVGAVKVVASTSYGVVAKTAEVSKNASVAVASKSYGAVTGVVSGSVSAVTSRLPSVPSLPGLKKSKTKED